MMKQEIQSSPTLLSAPALHDRLGLAAALLAPLSWGFTGIFVRLLGDLPASVIVTGRLLFAFGCLLPWLIVRGRAIFTGFDVPLAAAMGIYYILATEAFLRAPVVEVTLVIGFAPIIALGLERLRGRRPARQQVFGAGIAMLGLTLFLMPAVPVGDHRLAGNALALGAALLSAIYAVGLRARTVATRPVDPIALAAGACLFGTCMSLVLLFFEAQSVPTAMSTRNLSLLLSLGVISTALPTLAYGIASARLASVVTTSFGLLTPVFAALFAGLILGEWPARTSLPGAVLTMVGLVQVLRAKPT